MIVRQVQTTPTVSLSSTRRTTSSSLQPRGIYSSVSQTVGRTPLGTFAEAGLHWQPPLRHLPLTLQHAHTRLEWCRRQSSWLPPDWPCTVFHDESCITLKADDHRLKKLAPAVSIRVCFTKAYTPHCVTVWGAISNDSRSVLVILHTYLTAQRFVDTILLAVYYRSCHVIQGPVSNKVMSGLMPLAYLWIAFVPLIIFLGQQCH
ncbi:hypothetical protein TNCV_3168961 [Trichonephila clavipes]|nr:hypothetical protein TNCV_3168961 [Trichonephila clavipes]